MEQLGKAIAASTIKYLEMFGRNKLTFTWEIVNDPTFSKEDDMYVCKNIRLDTKIKEFIPDQTEIGIITELNNRFDGKHIYIYSITETPRMILPEDKRAITQPYGENIQTPIYNPYTFEDQVINIDKAFVIRGLFIKGAIRGSTDDKIFKGTKEDIITHLFSEIGLKKYPEDGIIQEPGLYEMKTSLIQDQLNKSTKNPTIIFYYKAEMNEYKAILITVTSIPVFIEQ